MDECYVYMYIISFYTTYDIILCVYIQKEFHKIVSIEQAICAFFTCIRVYVSRDSWITIELLSTISYCFLNRETLIWNKLEKELV